MVAAEQLCITKGSGRNRVLVGRGDISGDEAGADSR